MDIEFNETTHTYTRNNTNYISVTTLLKKYNLSADYTGIPANVLQEAANRGKYLHSCLEDFIKQNINKDPELLAPFVAYVNNRNIDLTIARSEEVIYDDTYLVAGTVDFQYIDGIDNIPVIADFKGTSTIHWDSVTWQTSIYNFILSKGNPLDYYFKKLQVIHFYNGRFTIRELPLIPYEEVEKLLKANLLNLPYTYNPDYTNILSLSESRVYDQLCNEIAEYETIIKDLKAKQEKLNKKIIDNMQASKNYKFVTDEYECKLSIRNGVRTLDKEKLSEYLNKQGENINNFYKPKGPESVSLRVNKINQDTSTVIDDIYEITKKDII